MFSMLGTHLKEYGTLLEGVIEALAFGNRDMLSGPCVDCGLRSGSYCDSLGVHGYRSAVQRTIGFKAT